jgi:branched-chain amino acid transport system permease protein
VLPAKPGAPSPLAFAPVAVMTQLVQTVLLGLLIGGIYALMASGLTLIFGVLGIINVAHGAFLILAALLTYQLWTATGLEPLLLILVTTPLMGALGWVVHRTMLVRVRNSPLAMTVVLTFALAVVIEGLMTTVWKNVFRSVRPAYTDAAFRPAGLFIPESQLYACGVAALVLGLLYLGLTRTWTGRAIRASADNPQAAPLVGIDRVAVAGLAYAVGVATAGAAGTIMSVLYAVFPASHYAWISRLLGIVVLGGMGSLPGALIGALLLGVAETVTATYVSQRWSTVVFYVVIMVVLLFRPHGLLGTRLREDVPA